MNPAAGLSSPPRAAPDSDSPVPRSYGLESYWPIPFSVSILDKSVYGLSVPPSGSRIRRWGLMAHCERPSESNPGGLSQVGLYLGNVLFS